MIKIRFYSPAKLEMKSAFPSGTPLALKMEYAVVM